MALDPTPEQLLADPTWLHQLTRHLVGADEAPDLAQDLAVAALSRSPAKLGRSWFRVVGRNLAISSIRGKARERKHQAQLQSPEPVTTPADLAETAELQQRAVAAVLALPPKYRDTVWMRVMQDMPIAAVAHAMGVPEETVRTRQRRALARIRIAIGLRKSPPGERRGEFAALLLPWLSWMAAVKTKHVVIAAFSILLLGTVATLAPWSGDQSAQPKPQTAPSAAAGQAPANAPDPTSQQRELAASANPTEEPRTTQPSAKGAPDEKASVTVQVRWAETSKPAKGIPVHVYKRRSTGVVTQTDAEGRATVSDLDADQYVVRLPGNNSSVLQLEAGENTEQRFALKGWVEVQGNVVDAAGGPAPFAELVLSQAGVAPQWSDSMGRCDGHGNFRIRMSLGFTLLRARHEHLGISDSLVLESKRFGVTNPDRVMLKLSPKVCSVRGQVVDATGEAVANAWVQLGNLFGPLRYEEDGQRWAAPPPDLRTTDADGRFLVEAALVESSQLTIYRAGFAAHVETLDLLPNGVHEVLVVLHPGATLRGFVRDVDGKPVQDAEISVDRVPVAQDDVAESMPDGTFQLDDLPPGDIHVSVQAKGYTQSHHELTVMAGEALDWEVTVHRGNRILGVLTDPEGNPLIDWWLTIPGANHYTKTDDQGRFAVAGCKLIDNLVIVRESWGFTPEVMRFEGVPASDAAASERQFVVPSDRRATARFRGRLVDATNTPLAAVEINLYQRGRRVFIEHQETITGADGRFECGPLPPDAFKIMINHKDWAFDDIVVELNRDATLDLGTKRGTRK